MNFSRTFVDRPIATSLVMAAILLAGLMDFTQLPLAMADLARLPFGCPVVRYQHSVP